MPFTSVADFLATESLTSAEHALIAECRAGRRCTLDSGSLPTEGTVTPERHIRATLLRVLIMGGTPECGLHAAGVTLKGAYITGGLDLRMTKTRSQLILENCRFDTKPQIAQAEIARLYLKCCHLPGLAAQGIRVDGDAVLRQVVAQGTVSFAGAKIGGQLSCADSHFEGTTPDAKKQKIALRAKGLKLGGDLSLQDSEFIGSVVLTGATIGGQLIVTRASLEGKDTSDGKAGEAFLGQSMSVAQGLNWKAKAVLGTVILTSAIVSNLDDEMESWPKEPNRLRLNGFIYAHLSGSSALTYGKRKSWLACGSRIGSTFDPQAYTQFAKVLREMGHASEARKVLMERDCLLFVENHKTNLTALNAARMVDGSDVGVAWLRYYLLRFWAWFTSRVSGYGHAPQRALFWSLVCMLFGAEWFFLAWQAGVMVPNSAIILTSPDWLAAMAINHDAPSAEWLKLKPSIHYETFYPPFYALDVFVPFVSLGQEDAWAATTVTWFGCFTRWFTFAYQIIGWSITALGIAAITGFVQKNQPD